MGYPTMRIDVILDDKLVAEAMKLSGAKSVQELIEIALREFIKNREMTPPAGFYSKGGMDQEDD